MKQKIAEETITNDSETPPVREDSNPPHKISEYLKHPEKIQSIISSNEELIRQHAMTIKTLQIVNAQQAETIKKLTNKYESLVQLLQQTSSSTSHSADLTEVEKQNQKNSLASSFSLESILAKIRQLQQELSKTKIELALKSDQLLSVSLSQQTKERKPIPQSTKISVNHNNLETYLDITPIQFSLIKTSKQKYSEQIIEQWKKYLSSYEHLQSNEKFKEKTQNLIKKFIPMELRGKVWNQLVQNKIGITNALYMSLLDRRKENWVCLKVQQQVEKDIKRSFHGKTQYIQTKAGLIIEVTELLQIFHIFRPDVSYVQGMTYPVIILIPILGKIKAFTVFCNLILGNSFFRKIFSLEDDFVSTVCKAFELILQEYQPKLYERMHQHSIHSQIFLIQWLFTIFSRGLSYESTLKFWDHLLYYEQLAFFRIGLSVFQQLSPKLMKADYEESISLIKNLDEHIEEQQLLDSFSNSKLTKEKLSKTLFKAARQKCLFWNMK